MRTFFESITAIAGVALSLGYYPQAYQILKTKSTRNVSLLSYSIFAIGTAIWFAYGLYVHSMIIALGFVFGVIGSWSVLFLLIKYKNSQS